MKINKELLAIKGYFFLRYAGSGPLVMLLPLLVRSKGVSAHMVGLLWTVLPVVALVTNSISGTLADYLKAHRTVFLSSVISLTAGAVAIYWIPNIPFANDTLEEAISLASMGNATLRSMGNSSSLGMLGLADIDPDMTVGEGGAALPPGGEALGRPGDGMELSALIQYPQFWLVFFALMVEQMGISTSNTMADTVCMQILGSESHKYGRQRLWGTIGMGVSAILYGYLIDWYSQGLPEKDYLPAVIGCIVVMFADVVLVARMRIPFPKDQRLRMGEVRTKLMHPRVLLFLMTVYVMGMSLGIVWVFKLMLVEDVALAWDPEFPALKLLQGMNIAIESFLGEVPFFFIAGMLIQRLGYTAVLATSLVSLGVRCCLYYTVSNPWYFLPIELLNGLSYSLFHSAMASYASFIAPQGAQATLQSVVRATFVGGLSTAGCVGGVLYNTLGGSIAFLQVGVFDLGYVVVFVLLHFLIKRYHGNATGKCRIACCRQGPHGRDWLYCITLCESSCGDVKDDTEVDAFTNKPREAMKEPILEKKCPEAPRTMVATHEATGDECVRFIV
ncbi:Major facilitator superfamily domain-containing protein 6 [Chionoecetes opilio]|uniref:Major facilitator superfamily domain-containing protein 6 n=1 Tax=Chionoecetes opilio TaxID=41210 RepID=A0A8J4Y9K6_CHIOP|nr:Major facilitator superfamily domain-containing protein 6 [Chionoecetes opilio]